MAKDLVHLLNEFTILPSLEVIADEVSSPCCCATVVANDFGLNKNRREDWIRADVLAG